MEHNKNTNQKLVRISDTSPNHPKSLGYKHWRLVVLGLRGMNWQIAKKLADEIGVKTEIVFDLTHPCDPRKGKILEELYLASLL